jgi:hypothetical protein
VTTLARTGRLDASHPLLCERPAFVIGSPRSGTTALARALGRHSELWTSHESYVLNRLYGGGRAERAWRQDAEREQAPSLIKTEEVTCEEFLAALGLGFNALYTSRSGGRQWIDQTPLNTLLVDDLAAMFPTAVFLHALRDGRLVVQSMSGFLSKVADRPAARKYVPSWAEDFPEACRTWARYAGVASTFCSAHPDRSGTVRTDRLADPDAQLAAVYDLLGVAAEAGPGDYLRTERVNSSWEADLSAAPSRERLPEWDAERRSIFADEAGETMLRLRMTDRAALDAWVADGRDPAAGDYGAGTVTSAGRRSSGTSD